MIVEINIDCKKTENALKAVSCILETPISTFIKDQLQLNEVLMSIAKGVKDKPEVNDLVKSKHPEAYKLLMEVL